MPVTHLALATVATIFLGLISTAPASAGVVQKVRTAGALACGVVTEETDYTKFDTHGGVDDIGAEFCKAVAVAVLGRGARATVTGFPDEDHAFRALADGKLDLLAAATPSVSNGALYGVAFGPPIFIDAQGFLVAKDSGIARLRDLAGKQICFIANTDHEANLTSAMKQRGISFMPYPWEETGEMDAGLVTGHCAAMTADISTLAEERAAFHARKHDFAILPETITLDPVAPAVRRGDPDWAAIVGATVAALLQAEASGVTQANVQADRKTSDDPAIRRLLGGDRAAARALGLADDWAAQVVLAVGNYAELYARAVGPGTEYDLPRGMNALWRDGGLLFPMPVR
jgi:general L-amino acid transport system substrate-binding protein